MILENYQKTANLIAVCNGKTKEKLTAVHLKRTALAGSKTTKCFFGAMDGASHQCWGSQASNSCEDWEDTPQNTARLKLPAQKSPAGKSWRARCPRECHYLPMIWGLTPWYSRWWCRGLPWGASRHKSSQLSMSVCRWHTFKAMLKCKQCWVCLIFKLLTFNLILK